MKKDIFIEGIRSLREYEQLQEGINKEQSPIVVHGLIDSQIAHIISSLGSSNRKQCLVITYNHQQAKKIYEDLCFFSKENVYLFPNKELLFYNYDAYSRQNMEERVRVLTEVNQKNNTIVVASIDSLLYRLMAKDTFFQRSFSLKYGQVIQREEIINGLISLRYERCDMVEAKGQFSSRGGIIDFYPIHEKSPYRIELFDDEIDSIRQFDSRTQLSLEKKDEVILYPVKEVLQNDASKIEGIEKIEKDKLKLSRTLIGKANERLQDKINNTIEQLQNNMIPQGFENYLNYFYEDTASLIDYMDEKAFVFVDEPSRVMEKADHIQHEIEESFKMLLEKGEVLPGQIDLICHYDEFVATMKKKQVFVLSNLPKNNPFFESKNIVNFSSRTAPTFHGKIDLFTKEIKNLKYKGYKSVILSSTKERAIRLEEALREDGIECSYLKELDRDIKPGQIVIIDGQLRKGFEYHANKFLVITEDEIFGSAKKKRTTKRRDDARPIKSFIDLKVGDYVVHENHGIGKYVGIEQLNVQGAKKDYLKLKYSGEDLLYVPIEQMDLIQKYIGPDIKAKLSKLGGIEWKKAKAKVKGAIVDMAEELLKLSAIRQNSKGYAFSEDTLWQRQFEDMFPYEETPDQLRSIKELKEDMEKDIPMDRLLCGDVGYGKTEVAIRGIFKCIMEGKQASILVPTTILAQQHYNTMVERFKEFPVTIEMLSRFRTAKQQKKIIEEVELGNIDIIIGTHRILSKDIKFKDLGLLIIDEEQRFGVKHKESLKQLRKNVDILTLTATPIPRTLHMSLIGLRDMSTIEEPPEERYPVQTYVVEYHEEMIKEAIIREMDRGGQVYFVFNRVQGIDKMAIRISELVPDARIAVAHGQMSERQLENIMLDFMNDEYDILICTTIIETGLDISSANTMIIYDADHMGLSQLYQLRGRVGRSNQLAYAYLTYEKDKVLTEVAEKRLQAIKEFTEFGSGFKIAMRDLEIRGAGNLLGGEQHGQMATIGYDLYCKLLEETVREMKGEEIEENIETSIEININAFIPEKYIPNENHKLEIYKKIAGIRSQQDADEIEEEIEDRFGNIPEPVRNLIHISFIKSVAQRIGISNISETKTHVKLQFENASYMKPMMITEAVKFYGNRIEINGGTPPYIKLSYYNEQRKYKDLKQLLEKISSLHNQ
ncbi:transcription-repair coupling factor [Lutibacter sp. B2]|nr:transcription-repair coupling factor [Lutibacter sp. B2]